MKYLKLITLLIFSFSQSQSIWQQLPNIITNIGGERFDDVFFLNEDLGWAANGSVAKVFKTIDGGLNWTEQLNELMLSGNYYFRNIEFIDENIGFLGTLNGKFFKSIDGGDNWTEVVISPNPPAICGLDAVDSNIIYGCGAYFEPAYVIKSIDRGETWTYIDLSIYATALVEVLFFDELNGFASGRNELGGIILKTEDGGITWSEVYNTNVSGDYIWKLQALPSNNNNLFGAVYSVAPNIGRLIKSSDGGTNWVSLNTPVSEVEAIGFISETTGYIGGDFNGIYQTNDGGLNWSFINLGGNLNRFQILSSNLAYAAGYSIYKLSEDILSNNIINQSNSNHLDVLITKNPVKNLLKFEINFNNPDNLLIELYSSNGKFIEQLSSESIFIKSIKKYSFSVHNLSAGSYILDFHSNSGRTTKKFIKQ